MTVRSWIERARTWARDERGQTFVEYALIITAIAVGVTLAMGLLRTELAQVFSDVANAF